MNTISPIRPNLYFKGKTKPADNNSKETTIKNNEPYKKDKDAWIDGFLAGATIGTLAVSAGLNIYNRVETSDLMKDMMEEYQQDDTKSMKVENVDDEDNTPEIILEKTDGTQYIYDFKKHSVGIKMDDEIIEKIR